MEKRLGKSGRPARYQRLDMPAVPAICQTCGTVFPSGIFAENSRNISFVGNRSGPCPNCGGMGEIPDGVYDFVGDTVRVVASSGYSRSQLQRIATLLIQARAAGTPAADVASALEDEAPELAEIAKRLLVPRTPADLVAWLMLLLLVIQMFIAKPSTGLSEKEVERLTEQAVEQAIQSEPAQRHADAAPAPAPVVKRPPPPPRKQRAASERQRKRRRPQSR